MWLKACVNGPRTRGEHPAVPQTPEQLTREAARLAPLGVQALHVHPKDDVGHDSLRPDVVDAAVVATRDGAPGLPVGVTTGAWAMPDPAERVAAIQSWSALPDFASVNWHEDGAERVAAELLTRGVSVEAGLWNAEAVQRWARSAFRGRCLRVLLELPDGLGDQAATDQAGELIALVRRADPAGAVLLHGAGTSCWPTLRHAVRLGLATRIGLEDTLTLPDGSPAADNAALVEAAYGLADARPRSRWSSR